jgi:hypothetical protein
MRHEPKTNPRIVRDAPSERVVDEPIETIIDIPPDRIVDDKSPDGIEGIENSSDGASDGANDAKDD